VRSRALDEMEPEELRRIADTDDLHISPSARTA
jgi:hypothetical protein